MQKKVYEKGDIFMFVSSPTSGYGFGSKLTSQVEFGSDIINGV
jgi:hypothetical protein